MRGGRKAFSSGGVTLINFSGNGMPNFVPSLLVEQEPTQVPPEVGHPLERESLRKTARQYFEDAPPSHDWQHVLRVRRTALELAEHEEADEKTLEAAAFLHDIGRVREMRGEIEDHATWSGREARRILKQRGYETSTIDPIVHCIRTHRYSNDAKPETLEAKILCDADNLDALGAIGIARTFAYSGENDRLLADADRPPESDDSEAGRTGLNHLVKKILTLKDRMYTDTGRQFAEERHRVVGDFVKRLRKEVQC